MTPATAAQYYKPGDTYIAQATEKSLSGGAFLPSAGERRLVLCYGTWTQMIALAMSCAMPADPVEELRVEGISKTYPGVRALNGVSFSVAGHDHGLAGQNGAGKSTLIKILSGAQEPDEGYIYLGGRAVRFRAPPDAQSAGIQTIHQELSLVPQLSVAENIFLGQVPLKPFSRIVDWTLMHQGAREALARIGFDLDVRKPVGSYSGAEQQAVELAKALRKKRASFCSTSQLTLPPPDVKRLFQVLKALAAQGETMIYITHRLEELFELGAFDGDGIARRPQRRDD